MIHSEKEGLAARAEAIKKGIWLTKSGVRLPLRSLHDAHLINAYLKALAEGHPEGITRPLAVEVIRRGLADRVWSEALWRTKGAN